MFSSPPRPQEVHPNSPAAQAGLIPHTDYILGSDAMATDDDLYTLVETHNHQSLKLYVYNAETDACREVRERAVCKSLLQLDGFVIFWYGSFFLSYFWTRI